MHCINCAYADYLNESSSSNKRKDALSKCHGDVHAQFAGSLLPLTPVTLSNTKQLRHYGWAFIATSMSAPNKHNQSGVKEVFCFPSMGSLRVTFCRIPSKST
mmetsp:Transcript_10313/g.15792  ORF Transcript_10313/g.15792 Transcript_10313/m.15792 type:complete len:102 (-) Transcript_10313:7-312(-)